ncbi:MAG: hypothetical protein OXF65_04290 [Acidimicrobiaceae bacterium]|nr:hypothetical protein [Acidimicrobiaceae bacterium]
MPSDDDLPDVYAEALKQPQLLVVEGNDDLHVVRAIKGAMSGVGDFGIYPAGNVDEVLDLIPQVIRSEVRVSLGIMIDGNDEPDGRWQSVRTRLERVGVDSPAEQDSMGTLIEESDEFPRVGVWLMPDNGSPGELEDFIERMIPDDDPVWPRSQSYVQGIPASERKFSEGKILRAYVHAWLAVRNRPRPMGLAITARDLDVTAPICVAFVDWLRRLFGEDEANAS